MPVRKRDTTRAIGLLEDYCSRLRKPEEQQLKTAILRVMDIFKSSLFQALLGKRIVCSLFGCVNFENLKAVCVVSVVSSTLLGLEDTQGSLRFLILPS